MAVFNAYEATNPRLKKKPFNEGATAGMPKSPSSRGGKSRAEMKALGERNNYQDRELDARAVANLSADEYLWFETLFPERLEAATEREAIKQHNEAVMKQVGAQQFWNKYWGTQNQASPEESKRLLGELQKFQASFPQFIVSRGENEIILQWLRDRNLELNYRNLVESFEANALAGALYLNPGAIGAGSESEVTGTGLTMHHNFHLLIQPQRRPTAEEAMSADQWLAGHDELKDKRESPFALKKKQKAESTQAYFAQAASVQAKGNVVNVVDYGPQTHGVPPEPEKYSFKQKIRARRCPI